MLPGQVCNEVRLKEQCQFKDNLSLLFKNGIEGISNKLALILRSMCRGEEGTHK